MPSPVPLPATRSERAVVLRGDAASPPTATVPALLEGAETESFSAGGAETVVVIVPDAAAACVEEDGAAVAADPPAELF